jgi:hypothetical protein
MAQRAPACRTGWPHVDAARCRRRDDPCLSGTFRAPSAQKAAVPKRSTIRSEGLGSSNSLQRGGPGSFLERDGTAGIIHCVQGLLSHCRAAQVILKLSRLPLLRACRPRRALEHGLDQFAYPLAQASFDRIKRDGQRDQFCFRRAVENPSPGGVRVVFAGQHRLEPFLDQLNPVRLEDVTASLLKAWP